MGAPHHTSSPEGAAAPETASPGDATAPAATSSDATSSDATMPPAREAGAAAAARSGTTPGRVGGSYGRIVGVDTLRGAVLALMVLTPFTGGPGRTYPHLGHAAWDGFTVADAILPAFLVTSGASLALLLRGPLDGERRLRLIRRLLALLVLGVAYNAIGQPLDLGTLRLTGVLQLIGVSGALATVVLLVARLADPGRDGGTGSSRRHAIDGQIGDRAGWAEAPDTGQAGTEGSTRSRRGPLGPGGLLVALGAAGAVQAVHGMLLARGSCPAGQPECNPLHGLEVALVGAPRTYAGGELGYDPEGVAAMVAATALVLLGAVAMGWLLHRGIGWRSLAVVVVAGVLLVGIGLLLDGVQPINKRLHTPAFTALAGGIGVIGLGLAVTCWDLTGRRKPGRRDEHSSDGGRATRSTPSASAAREFSTALARRTGRLVRAVSAWPLTTLGRNALVVFFVERAVIVALASTPVPGPDGPRSLQQALVGGLLGVEGPRVHLALSALVLAVVWVVTVVMRALRWRIAL